MTTEPLTVVLTRDQLYARVASILHDTFGIETGKIR